MVAAVERESRENLTSEEGRADAVAREPEAVVNPPTRAEIGRWVGETSIGPPHAWVIFRP